MAAAETSHPSPALLAKVRAVQAMQRELEVAPVTTTAEVMAMEADQVWRLLLGLRGRVEAARRRGEVRPPLFGGAA